MKGWKQIGAGLVLAAVVAAGLVGCSNDTDEEPSSVGGEAGVSLPSDLEAQGNPLSAQATSEGAVSVEVDGVASIAGGDGSMASEGELTAVAAEAVEPPEDVGEMPLTRVGTGVWVASDAIEGPLTVTFPDAEAPRGEALVALHMDADGIWTPLEGGTMVEGGGMAVTTDEFSFVTWATTNVLKPIGDFLAAQLGGRTDPPTCEAAPDWVDVIGNPSGSTHSCARTGEPRDDGTEIAEVEIKSNRGTFQWVQVPANNREYLWVEGQPDFVRTWIANTFDSGTTILLRPGGRMTIGYRQPDSAEQYAFTTYGDNPALLLSTIYHLVDAGMDKAFDTAGGWVVVAKCLGAVDVDLANLDEPAALEIPNPGTLIKCVANTIADFYNDPSKAVDTAEDLLGGPGGISADDLTNVSQSLYKAGKYLKALSLVKYLVLEQTFFTDILTTLNGSPNAADTTITLDAGRRADSSPTYDEIANAEIPSLCGHPPTRLVDGEHTEVTWQYAYLRLRETLNYGQPGVVRGVPSDEGPLTAVVATCNQGGVGWPSLLILFSEGGNYYGSTLLDDFDWSSINMAGPGRDGIVDLRVKDGLLWVSLFATYPEDAECCPTGDASLALKAEGGQLLVVEATENLGD